MKKTFLDLMLVGANVHECFAEDQGPLLKAQLSLKQAEEFCLQEGHEFRMLANPIVMADLGGTPEPEVIFDYGALMCVGDSWLYRGSMGVPVDIYAAQAEDGYLSKNGYELVPFEGHWALKFKMHPSFKDTNCVENCCRYVNYPRGGLVEAYSEC